MAQDNPYSPPGAGCAEPPEPPFRQGAISEQGWTVMKELARWVKKVSRLFYLLGGLLALIVIISLGLGNEIQVEGESLPSDLLRMKSTEMVSFGISAVEFFLSALLLGKAGDCLLGNQGEKRGRITGGFRELGLYLLLGTVFQLIFLLEHLAKWVQA